MNPIQSRPLPALAPQFQGRLKSMLQNPKNQAVAMGVSSAVGGAYTLGGQASIVAHGFQPDASNLLAGSFNAGVGSYNIKNGGGLKQLKNPGNQDLQ